MSFSGTMPCDCGASLTITSDSMTGATIEICDGCGYSGPARARMDLPLRLAAPSDCDGGTSSRLCIDGCGRQTRTPRATRCRECDREHEANDKRRERARERMRAIRGSQPRSHERCIEGCGRPLPTKKALRCPECARAAHEKQKAAAKERAAQRAAGQDVPLLRQRRSA